MSGMATAAPSLPPEMPDPSPAGLETLSTTSPVELPALLEPVSEAGIVPFQLTVNIGPVPVDVAQVG